MTSVNGLDASETFEQDETNLNFAFGLYSFSTNGPIDPADYEGLFQWRAFVVDRDTEGFDFIEIGFHRCTDNDWKNNLFPEQKDGGRGSIL